MNLTPVKYLIFTVCLVLLNHSECFSKNSHFFQIESVKDSASVYFKKAVKNDNLNKHGVALRFYLKARNQYEKRSDIDSVAVCNLEIYLLLISQNNIDIDSSEYLDAYKSYVLDQKDTILLMNLTKIEGNSYLANKEYKKAIEKYRLVIDLAKKSKKNIIKANTYSTLAHLYTNYKIDSAKQYFDIALNL